MKASRWLLAIAPIALALATGCSGDALPQPMTVSTKTDAVAIRERFAPIEVEACETMILLVPVDLASGDEMIAALLDTARSRGGDAVVDVHFRSTGGSAVVPFYSHGCYVATGTPVKLAQ